MVPECSGTTNDTGASSASCPKKPDSTLSWSTPGTRRTFRGGSPRRAAWPAQLEAHGLARGCFVPLSTTRQMHELTRTRTAISDARSRKIQRLEKFLESLGVNLSSGTNDIVGA